MTLTTLLQGVAVVLALEGIAYALAPGAMRRALMVLAEAPDQRLRRGGLIAAIFLLKYGVGVELSMQPGLRLDPLFALSMAAGYGALTGLFSARPVALWLMVGRRA